MESTAGEQERRAFQQGLALLRQRMVPASVSHFREAAKAGTGSPAILGGLAVALYLAADDHESASLLVRLAERHSRQLALIPLLGETGAASTAHRPAIERRLREFMRAHAASALPRLYLAQLLASGLTEPPGEAVRLWKDAARLDRCDASPCLELARVEATRNHPDAAISWLKQAVQRDPKLAQAHYQLSRLYLQTNRRDLADKHLTIFRSLRTERDQRPAGTP